MRFIDDEAGRESSGEEVDEDGSMSDVDSNGNVCGFVDDDDDASSAYSSDTSTGSQKQMHEEFHADADREVKRIKEMARQGVQHQDVKRPKGGGSPSGVDRNSAPTQLKKRRKKRTCVIEDDSDTPSGGEGEQAPTSPQPCPSH